MPIQDEWRSPDGTIRLLLGDALAILPALESNSHEAVVTDPPYPGMTGGHDRNCPGGVSKRTRITESVGNEWNIEIKDWLPEAERICKFGMQVFCSYHSVAEIRTATTLKPVALATWHKRNSTPTGRNLPRYTTEYVWWLNKAPGLKWDAFDTTCFDVPMPQAGCFAVERLLNKDGTTLHPTQKPLELMLQLLEFDAKSVLDPFMGTGTTGVACIRTNRGFTGIEKNPDYWTQAVNRCKDERQRFPLFEKAQPMQRKLFAET
jgi:DNA modification methylase